MSDLLEQQKVFAEKRRGKNEHFFKEPWHRKVAKVFEKFTKRLTLGLLGKLLRVKPVEGLLPFAEIRSVLFLRTDGIGDAIVTTPLWKALKKRRPELVIGVAGSFRNIPILEQDPNVTYTYDFAAPDAKKRKQEIVRARAMQYDLVIGCTFHRTTRTAIQARRASKHGYTAYMLRGAPDNRVHLFSKIVFREGAAEMPMVLQLQYMLEQVLGIKLQDSERMPEIHIPVLEEAAIGQRVDALLAHSGSSRLVVIHTEAATPYREWGYENSYAFARKLTEEHPTVYVAFMSSPHRANDLSSFLKAKPIHARIGYFSTSNMFEAAALIRRSSLVVTPDTSIVHVANAEQKPIVGFYIKDTEWKPYDVPSYVFIAKEGSPISSIKVEAALKASNDLLDPSSATVTNKILHTVLDTL